MVPQGTQRITGKAFRIFFHTDCPIDNGFFNRPVLIRTQILVHRWEPSTRISALFTEISLVYANPHGSLHQETCTVAAKALPRPQSSAIYFWRIFELIINYYQTPKSKYLHAKLFQFNRSFFFVFSRLALVFSRCCTMYQLTWLPAIKPGLFHF